METETTEANLMQYIIDNISEGYKCKKEIKAYHRMFVERCSKKFARARRVMAKRLSSDADLHQTYRDDVAMFLFDHCGIKKKKERDELADDLIYMIFNG